MSCSTASRAPRSPHSMITITAPTDAPMEQIPTERRASKAYQIFPESPMESESESWSEEHSRERLPSIVVDPTDISEVESGELRWPPGSQGPEEEEDPFQENGQPRTESPSNGQPQDDKRGEAGRDTIRRKSSIGPALGQLDYTRLTPPSSPTIPETVPPYPKS